MKKRLNTRQIKQRKKRLGHASLSMLTCYDFQSAELLNDTELDLILVGDSLGNVILGHPNTVQVSLQEMEIFGKAVVRGATNTFVAVDLPFGSYASFEKGIENAISLFQNTGAQALKLEGAHPSQLKLIERLTQHGVALMGHIGLTPQSVHQQGGYYTHGKEERDAKRLLQEALAIEAAGAFAIVLECITPEVSALITNELSIPTIGIGSGEDVDGQVLVLNDLFKMGKQAPPSFCTPIADLYQMRREMIVEYLKGSR